MEKLLLIEITILAIALISLTFLVIRLIKRVNKLENAIGFLLFSNKVKVLKGQEEEPFDEFGENNGKTDN